MRRRHALRAHPDDLEIALIWYWQKRPCIEGLIATLDNLGWQTRQPQGVFIAREVRGIVWSKNLPQI